MNYKLLLAPLLLLLLFAGCSQVEIKPTNYYILEYNSIFEDASLKRTEPIDTKVMIMDAEIPKAYSRNQIVSRTSK